MTIWITEIYSKLLYCDLSDIRPILYSCATFVDMAYKVGFANSIYIGVTKLCQISVVLLVANGWLIIVLRSLG